MVFNFPVMVIASAALTSTQQSCWTCQSQCSHLLYLLQQYRLVWEAAAYLHIFYHFFYNNSVWLCFSKHHHRGEELLCIHNFQGQPIGLCTFKKTIIFRVLCPELFDPHCQLTNYSWAATLALIVSPQLWHQLFLHGAEDSHLT